MLTRWITKPLDKKQERYDEISNEVDRKAGEICERCAKDDTGLAADEIADVGKNIGFDFFIVDLSSVDGCHN